MNEVREHMEVVGSCGAHVGTVDRREGSSIKLTKTDPDAGGVHHYIPTDWVASIDDKVHLNIDCGEAHAKWTLEPPPPRMS